MSQFDFGTIAPAATSGTTLASYLNSFRDAVNSGHKGSSRPSYVQAGMMWVDDSSSPVWKLKIYDGTDDIAVLQFNTSTNEASLPISMGGTGATTQSGARTSLGLGSLATKSTVGTSDVTAKAITLAKMADGTAGKVLGYNSSGVLSEITQSSTIELSRQCSILGSKNTYQHRLFIMANNQIRAVGDGSYGQNGDFSSSSIYIPTKICDPEDGWVGNIVKVCSSGNSNYAIDDNGKVYSWGRNSYGQLGHGDTDNRSRPEIISYFVTNSLNIVDVIPGALGTVAGWSVLFLTSSGRLYGCGRNQNGELGIGNTTQQNTPTLISSLTNVTAAAMSAPYHSVIAVTSGGLVYTWGYNYSGQLGLGDTSQRTTPVNVASLESISKVFMFGGSGSDGGAGVSSYVIQTDGDAFSAGYNGAGQLGLGDTTSRSAFNAISSITGDVTDIVAACGDNLLSTMFLVNDTGGSNVYVVGRNNYGQLGLDSVANASTPVKLTGYDFENVANRIDACGDSGYCTTYIGDSNNKLYSCGYNANGQMGAGITGSQQVFMKVAGIDGTIDEWVAIGNNVYYGPVVRYNDGRVQVAGYGANGMLGTRETNLRSTYFLTDVRF